MFKTVPKISNIQTYLKDNVFNINLELKDSLSTVRNDLTKFGVLITESPKQIVDYKASREQSLQNNSKVIFLSSNVKHSIAESAITCTLVIPMAFDSEPNKLIYITPFYYQDEFKSINNTLIYTFSTTEVVSLVRNDSIDTKILDYRIVDEINNLELDSLSSNINHDYGISELYTSFPDRYKANNYFFVNHALLSKFQKDKISNIINYNSVIIKNLLKPNIRISNKKQFFDFTTQKIQQIDYVYFTDEIHNLSNYEYKVKINYDFSSIYSTFTNLILSYKNNKNLNKEISLLSLLNIEQGLYSKYIEFNKKYQKFTFDKPTYNLSKIFDNTEEYIGKKNSINTLKTSARSSIANPYVKTYKINLPFKIDKFIRVSAKNIRIKDSAYVAIPDLVMFNGDKDYIANNKEMFNLLAINSAETDKLDFNQILSKKSTTATSRLLDFSEVKKIDKNKFVEDYKITNTIVKINDVVTKIAQDIVPQPHISGIERQVNDELFRKIAHTANGTIEQYQQIQNTSTYYYYYEIAKFNSQNLKDINWIPLTQKALTGLMSKDKIFCRLIPNMVDLKIQSNIFQFSYDINQIKTVGEIINYAS